ncbi:MAG: alcohol dehydrogenase catalytic domain-containing protein [Mycobacteriales bacterium]
MKAVVWHGVGDIRLDDVTEPKISEPTDAIVRITTSAICGTDLHMVRGTMPGMAEGTVLGHEAVGVVTEVGAEVRGFSEGDRVVVPSTLGCGACDFCHRGLYAQCDVVNPNGPSAGTAFFGGPASAGPFDGLQAEYARVPYAATNLVRLPDDVTDDQAILLSDILPTSWFGARLADVAQGDTVLVFGAGIVGQLAALSAKRQGATRVLMVDDHASRLRTARAQNVETIDMTAEDPVAVVRDLTRGRGADAVIDAVGIDAVRPKAGPARDSLPVDAATFDAERDAAAPDASPDDDLWVPGDAPSLVQRWAVEAVAKAGRIGVIGVYPPGFCSWPVGAAMNKNLIVRMGNCNHRRYLPRLVGLVQTGAVDLTPFITQHREPAQAIDAYETFDRRADGWLKTVLDVA